MAFVDKSIEDAVGSRANGPGRIARMGRKNSRWVPSPRRLSTNVASFSHTPVHLSGPVLTRLIPPGKDRDWEPLSQTESRAAASSTSAGFVTGMPLHLPGDGTDTFGSYPC